MSAIYENYHCMMLNDLNRKNDVFFFGIHDIYMYEISSIKKNGMQIEKKNKKMMNLKWRNYKSKNASKIIRQMC